MTLILIRVLPKSRSRIVIFNFGALSDSFYVFSALIRVNIYDVYYIAGTIFGNVLKTNFKTRNFHA